MKSEELPGMADAGGDKLELFELLLAEEGLEADTGAIPRRPDPSERPLSFAQERLWFLADLEPASAAYNVPAAVRLGGALQPAVLERCCSEIVRRHEVLRTRFAAAHGRPVQVVEAPRPLALPRVDLAGLAAAHRQGEATRLAAIAARRPFDLATGPLVHLALLRLGELEWVLLLTLHHIVCDGWSMRVLLGELTALYAAFAAGEPSPLPELPIQYTDYAAWQRAWLAGEVEEEQLAYWRRRLDPPPPALELPLDRPRPAVASGRGGTVMAPLPADLAAPLRELARSRGATLFATLLAAFLAQLHRTTAEVDLAVGSPVANRDRSEVRGLIGFLVNTLVLRVDAAGEPSFGELVERTREVTVGALAHQELPFERLVAALQPERDLSRTPFFSAMFAFEGAAAAPGGGALEGLELSSLAMDSGTAKFDLSLTVVEGEGGFTMGWEHSLDLFDRSTVERMAGHLATLLVAAVRNPSTPVGRLPLLTPAERHQLLDEWDAAWEPAPPAPTLGELFARREGRAPDAVAMVEDDGAWTYAEVARRSRRLACRLRSRGAGPEVVVAVYLECSPRMLVAELGVWAAGAALLPLDPATPPERLAFILEDAGARAVVTDAARAGELPAGAPEAVLVEDVPVAGGAPGSAPAGPRAGSDEGPDARPETGPENLAYIIYTSGSTGRPKGVAVEQGTVASHLQEVLPRYGMAPGQRMPVLASPGFDASFEQLLAPLTGTTAVFSSTPVWTPEAFLRYAAEAALTLADVPPPFWLQLAKAAVGEEAVAVPPLLERVWMGGDVMPADGVSLWRRGRLGHVALLNTYGPTEATITASVHALPPAEAPPARVPIGRPLPHRGAYVLDRRGRPLPTGVPGELYLGGQLARGYVGRPGLTAQAFVPHPFSAAPGRRLYRTGDRVRRQADGSLDFLGRFDHQVKVRGFRIELGEVEAVLGRHPDLEAVAVVVEGAAGSDARRLVACVVPRPGRRATAGELRRFLEAELPPYMLPARFVELGSLPATASGKVDRRALPGLVAESGATLGSEAGFVAPRDAVEESLAGIWREVLGVEAVGVHDNFFDLGGHSLLATQVASRLRSVFGVELPVRRLFEAPTVAALARAMTASGPAAAAGGLAAGFSAAAAGAAPPDPSPGPPVDRDKLDLLDLLLAEEGVEAAGAAIPRRAGGAPPPLSFAQQRLWFLDQLEPGSPAYNIPMVVRMDGELSLPALRGALAAVIERHETLRTTFAVVEGEAVQVIHPARPLPPPVVDLSGLAAGDVEGAELELARREAARPFHLGRGPLLRPCLLRRRRDGHTLLLSMHHIVSDGWSAGVLVRELAAFYRGCVAGGGPDLPELPIQYADFAVWQRRWLSGAVLEEELAYWRGVLSPLPPALELPTDRPRPPVQTFGGAMVPFEVSAAAAAALRRLSRSQGTTLFMTVLAGFAALLGRYSGQDDLTVGTPVANRGRTEVEGLIGFFVNTLVMRCDLAGDPPFATLLARVREAALGAYAHQDLPFERLVEELQPRRDLSRTPLFSVMLTLGAAPPPAVELPGLTLTAVGIEGQVAKFDLMVSVGEEGDRLLGAVEYNVDLFDATTATRLGRHFASLLERAVASPEERLSRLPVWTVAERSQVLVEWNEAAGGAAWGGRGPALPCLHVSVAEQAARTPERIALVDGDRRLTYGGLVARARRLAGRLRALGVGPEVRVAVCGRRRAELAVGLLGVLEAGGAYVALDPAYPAERLAFMLADSAAPVLLGDEAPAGELPPFAGTVVSLDGPWRPGAGPEGGAGDAGTAAPAPAATADNLAYVLYTSGSTGRPKGVAIEHGSAAALVSWARGVYGGGELSGVLAATSICFDLSVFELFATWAAGGKVVLAASVLDLPTLPAAGEVRLVNTVPSAMAELVRGGAGLPPSVAVVNLAGEALPGPLAAAVYGAGPRRLYNLYGPSEDTTYSTCRRVAPPAGAGPAAPPIGRPLPGTRAYVCGPRGEALPQGVVGELHLGGAGLARGYLARPALTARSFRPDGLSSEAGARLYRTGDLVRALPGGELAFIGRIDHQVKVRGFRIELGEVEAALGALPEVAEVAVVARGGGEGQLVAYVVPDGGELPPPAELRRLLRHRLPEHMLPTLFVELEGLPRTPSGKVDRRSLPAPEAGRPAAAARYVAPRTPTEGILAQVWAAVLGRGEAAPVGVEESFFDLGGHSLLATRVVSEVRRLFAVELPVKALFETPTVAGLAATVEALRQRGEEAAPPIEPVGRGAPLPLSFAQERLWFLDQLDPGAPVYNLPAAVRLEGELVPAVLAGALAALAARHESLRTTFAPGEEGPVQVVAARGELPLPAVDLTAVAAGGQKAVARRLLDREASRPFDLARGPLARALLLRLGPRRHLLLLTLHHIITDGWSVGVMVADLASLYRGLAGGEGPALEPLPIQYADFAAWQRGWLQGEVLEAQLAYWRRQLGGGVPVLELPTDRPRPRAQTFPGARVSFELPAPLARELGQLGRSLGATLFMTLLAGLHALLCRLTGQEDLAVGSPVANRGRSEVEGLIGFFVNTLVLRADLSGDPGFGEVLARVREVALEAYAHQDVPFERLVEELAPERDLAHTPFFSVLFLLHRADAGVVELPHLTLAPLEVDVGTAKFDLTVALATSADGVSGAVEYNTDLFDATTAARLARAYARLLAAAAAEPQRPLSTLALVAPAEAAQLRLEWNDTGAPPAGEACLHELVAAQAARTPERIALVAGGERLSYAGLTARAEGLARHLRRLGVGPEVRVAVCGPRTAELPVAILAVLAAGGAYVPLDPAYPRQRLATILEDSAAAVLLADGGFPAELAAGRTVVPLGGPPAGAACEGESSAGADPEGGGAASPQNLADVLYTSGSTGRPKGVAITHASAVALVRWAQGVFSPGQLSGVLAATSICFDLSVFELFVPWASGGKVVLAASALELPVLAPAGEVRLLNTVPSAMAELLRQGPLPPSVEVVNLAGEALGRELAEAVHAAGVPRLFNLYGPSEDTTYSTWAAVAAAGGAPPIGRPVAGTRAYVLDRRGDLLPLGAMGELHLAGAGLARGYLARPALTAERFVPDALSGEAGGRLYRTGDRVRHLPGGELAFLGRLDHQVKLRGFRIELGEVEAALARHPQVREAAVLLRPGAGGEPWLVAYASPAGEALPEGEELRRFLTGRLPEYMVPALVVALPELPHTPNGKLDRRALAALEEPGQPRGRHYVAPRTPGEELMAELWAAVLGLEGSDTRVGVEESFFALGGHSLLATRLIAQVRRAFGVELGVKSLFAAPTVAALTAVVEELAGRGEAGAAPPLVPVSRDGELPLSFAQERLWFLDQLDPGSAAYNLPMSVRLEGELAVAALGRALAAVVARHEVLRTTFDSVDGRPLQVIHPPFAPALPVVDLSALPAAARGSAAGALAGAEVLRPFQLRHGPLLRALLVRLGPASHGLVLTLHHIVSDGWSMGVLVEELTTLYAAFRQGRPSPLPPLPVGYADYATWQRRWLRGEALAAEVEHWRRSLAGASGRLDLPTDRPRPAVQTYRGAQEMAMVPAPLAAALTELGRRRGATLFMTLLAAFKVLLGRLAGQEDVVVGSPIAGRGRAEVEGLVGIFLNTLALRTDLSGNPSFLQVLERVRETTLGAYAHQEVPFERLLAELEPQRDLARTPLFQVFFNMLNLPRRQWTLPGLAVEVLSTPDLPSKFDLTLYLAEAEDGIHLNLTYNADLFDSARMVELLRQYQGLLAQVVAAPEAAVASHALLTPEAASHLPDPRAPLPAVEVEGLMPRLAAQAERVPERIAVAGEGEVWSYGALLADARRLARELVAAGLEAEGVVAVYAPRGPALVRGLLAVLAAGGAFLILDPAYPPARLAAAVELARPRAWLAGSGALPPEALAAQLASLGPRVELADGAAPAGGEAGAPLPELPAGAGPDALAYVAFTSGSTGRPKGILGRHGPLPHFLAWHCRTFDLTEGDRFSMLSGLAHDPLLRDVFTPLWLGATLAIPEALTMETAGKLAAWMAARRVTVSHLTPAMAQVVAVEAAPASLPALRYAFFGGDVLTAGDVARLRALAPAAACVGFYGATETPQAMAYWRVPAPAGPADPGERYPVGRGIDGVQLLILDPRGRLAGVGELGEICVRTPYLTLGYLGDAAATRERYPVNPFTGAAADRLYRTGDLGRYRPDGAVDFAGRADDQVQVRGFRVEPAEIAAVLARHPAVAEAAVVPQGEGWERRLVAFVVAAPEGGEPAARELAAYLSQRLPAYMLPAAFVSLPALPLTPAGKLDRRALPMPEPGLRRLEAEVVPPRDPMEELLAGIWAEVLAVDAVGVEDSFFALGGHSLLATRVCARVWRACGVELPVRSLFEAPTVAALARLVAQRRAVAAGGEEAAAPIPRAGEEERRQLSFAQSRLWLLDRLDPGSAAYNIPAAVRLGGALVPAALTAALAAVVRRHETLRTTFPSVDGRPRQVVGPPRPVPLPLVDLSGLPPPAGRELARRLAAGEAGRPFDLAAGPLLRARLLRLGSEEHVLLLTVHHIVTDGWSSGVLVRELAALYRAWAGGGEAALPLLPIQYADYAAWQRRRLTGEVLEAQLAYWRRQLVGSPPLLDLPTDRPRPPVQTFPGATRAVALAPERVRALTAVGRPSDATLFMTLLAGFAALLHRITGEDDLTVGTPVANRARVEVEGLIGFFVNTLVLRADLSGGPTFADLLARVREVALGAYAHQDLPFERLVEELQPERDLGRTPLFSVMFVLQQAPPAALELPGLTLSPLPVEAGAAKFDLTLSLVEAGGVVGGSLEYNTDLFDATTMGRFLDHYDNLLAAVAEGAEAPVAALPLLSPAEAAQLLVEWNDTAAVEPAEAATLPAMVAAQAARTPERVALVWGGERLSYGELLARARRLARRLRGLGVGPEVRVAVWGRRRPELLVGLLGVMEAGGAYVPLDPGYPTERVRFMLRDSAAAVILADADLLAGDGPGAEAVTGATAVPLDDLAGEGCGGDDLAGEGCGAGAGAAAGPGNLADVLYTSGSTGRPKGVAIEHRSAVAMVRWAQGIFTGGELEGVLAATSVCFDLSVFELFVPWSCGGTVILATSALELPALPAAGAVRLVNTVPSAMAELVRAGALPPSVAVVNLAGEALQRPLVEAVHTAGVERVYNLYGPSEDTTYSTWARQGIGAPGTPPIGRPLAGTRAYVLDGGGRPVPLGVVGELHLGGAGLARGYLGRPALTARSFVPDALGGGPGARLYRTGDLVRSLPTGELVFLGRIDHQVKLRGFRIELGEVEAALARHPGVREAAVLVRRAGTEEARLVAYLVPTGGELPPAAALREHLRASLPEVMLPSIFAALESLPSTPTGKVDRRALAAAPEPEATGLEDRPAAQAPRDARELALAQLFAEVLGRGPVGVGESFFALGGHSLAAVRLVAEIRRRLGVELPLTAVFQAPTVERLAALLRRREREAGGDGAAPLLVAVQPAGARPPLFCVHPAGGDALGYFALARNLGPEQPLYALQSRGLEDDAEPLATVEEMARAYCREIRRAQPAGPYRLAGWSFGGLVAYEMARQLTAAGEGVALLAILDTGPPLGAAAETSDAEAEGAGSEQAGPAPAGAAESEDNTGWLLAIADYIGKLWGREVELAREDLEGLAPEAQLQAFLGRLEAEDLLPPEAGLERLRRLVAVFKANIRAAGRYRPGPYPGRITLFRAEAGRHGGDGPEAEILEQRLADPALGWGELATEPVEVTSVPGDHITLLAEPHVGTLAAALERALEETLERAPSAAAPGASALISDGG